MAAPERFAKMSDFSLAPRAPSIHGTKRHFAATQQMVAFGGKADIGPGVQNDAFDPQNGHQQSRNEIFSSLDTFPLLEHVEFGSISCADHEENQRFQA